MNRQQGKRERPGTRLKAVMLVVFSQLVFSVYMEVVFSEERNTLVRDQKHSSSRHVQQICLQEGGLYMSVYTTAPTWLHQLITWL